MFCVGVKHLNLLLQNTKPTKSDLSSSQGVLFLRKVNGGSKWFEDGDEDNDRKYIGEIENGKPNGTGTITFPDGEKCEGKWKDGKIHGQGTRTFPDGEKYVGEFKDGEYNGQGTYTHPNGDKYMGEFKDGKRNGQGTTTLPNGDKFVGGWKDGKPWNGTYYDKEGNILGKWVNGKMIKQ